jgi:Rod binding domain-containing protein
MSVDALTAQSGLALQQAQASRALPGGRANVDKAATDFEAMFLSQMFQHMFSGIQADGLFGGGHAEEMFRSMMVDEYAKLVASRGGVGIADSVRGAMLKMQEVQ